METLKWQEWLSQLYDLNQNQLIDLQLEVANMIYENHELIGKIREKYVEEMLSGVKKNGK